MRRAAPGRAHPLVCTPLEVLFPPGESFKHFSLKWFTYGQLAARSVLDPALGARLRDITARMFTAMGARSYGRCDIRMDRAEQLFMLEFNEVPCIFYPPTEPGSADLILAREPGGPTAFLMHVIDCARRACPGGEARP